MADIPVCPVVVDGLLPEPSAFIHWLSTLESDVDELVIDPCPPSTSHLPDVLAAAGIRRVITTARVPSAGVTWRGSSGERITVNQDHGSTTEWIGDLPATEPSNGTIASQRFVQWGETVAALAQRGGTTSANAKDHFQAWNPSPRARRCVVAFPATAGKAPWALRDVVSGARHPVQVIEGATGPEWLTSAPLAGLGSATYASDKEPVDGGAPWEVSSEILDNGLVRAEFDLYGQVSRLCFGGRFVDVAGPLFRAGKGDAVLDSAPARITVLEDGPIRARLRVTRETAAGVLHLTFTLHAFDPCLRLSIAWDGDSSDRWVDIPTLLRAQPWQRCCGFAAESMSADTGRWHYGVSWCRLDDGDHGGLVVGSPLPFTAAVSNGCIRVRPRPGLSIAITDPAIVDPSALLDTWLFPGEVGSIAKLGNGFRLVAPSGVALGQVRSHDDGSIEFLLMEQARRRARVWLHAKPAGQAWIVNLRGSERRAAQVTPEGDGFQIDLPPGLPTRVLWQPAE